MFPIGSSRRLLVEPIHPFEGGEFDGFSIAPGAAPVDHLGLEEPVDGRGERAVIAVADAAEELYRKALSIAVDQGAKLWELRTATSLARRCRDQRRRGEVRDLLAPVYDCFTEGFDTADLKDTKALLDELQ